MLLRELKVIKFLVVLLLLIRENSVIPQMSTNQVKQGKEQQLNQMVLKQPRNGPKKFGGKKMHRGKIKIKLKKEQRQKIVLSLTV